MTATYAPACAARGCVLPAWRGRLCALCASDAHAAWLIKTAGRTCRFLWTVRRAIPWPVRLILGVAMAVKCLPLDMGVDEFLALVAVVLLNVMRPGLMRACWKAAEMRA
jgi:hypothetical protein